MKKLIMIGIIILLSAHISNAEDIDCGKFERLARVIMENRQNDIPMSKMMSVLDADQRKSFFGNMVIAAYEHPSYRTAKMQQNAVDEFADNIYLQCVKSTREK